MARKRVIELTSSTATLSKNQSGSLIVLNRAAGIVVTLPTAGRGLNYDFVVKTSVTSNTYTISAGSSMRGTFAVSSASGVAPLRFQTTDLTARVASMNGSQSGGLISTRVNVVCDSDGVWTVTGIGVGNAPPATPFGTT